jgi:hypothetical protein
VIFGSRELAQETLSRILNISRYACAALAVLALAFPVQASAVCCCRAKGALASKVAPAATPAGGCCHAKSQDGQPAGNPDDHSGSSAPPSCPHSCTSPCCLGAPPSQVSTESRADFYSLAPIGLIFVQAAQQPITPALDGLLRPPRA